MSKFQGLALINAHRFALINSVVFWALFGMKPTCFYTNYVHQKAQDKVITKGTFGPKFCVHQQEEIMGHGCEI